MSEKFDLKKLVESYVKARKEQLEEIRSNKSGDRLDKWALVDLANLNLGMVSSSFKIWMAEPNLLKYFTEVELDKIYSVFKKDVSELIEMELFVSEILEKKASKRLLELQKIYGFDMEGKRTPELVI